MKRIASVLACIFMTMWLLSCSSGSDVDDLRQDIADLQDRATTLEEAVAVLRNAAEYGRSITSVTSFSDESGSGWRIVFSNGQHIDVLNGKDGKDGKDGNYSDGAGCIIKSVVEDEESGVVIFTLADGSEFRINLEAVYPSGIVALVRDVEMIEKYEVRFDFRINPSNARFVPVVDGKNTNIELDLISSRADADSYVTAPGNFKLKKVEQALNARGEVLVGQYTAVVEDLGVSTGYSDYAALVVTTRDGRGEKMQLSSELIGFNWKKLAGGINSLTVGGVAAKAVSDDVFMVKVGYETNVKSMSVSVDAEGGTVSVGGVSNPSSIDLSNPVKLVYTADGGYKREYTVVAHYTNLPVVYVTTPSDIISKTVWTEGCGIQIWNAGENNDIYADVQIKGRGNSTWNLDKKPYAIKLDSKATVMGMPKHKRWVLLANYMDNTGMCNDLSFKIAQSLPGMAWNPHGYHVDLVMNGRFDGSYYLCEQIKVDKNRVNITEIAPTDVDDVSKTGGYIFELDTYFDEAFKFKTSYFKNQFCTFYNDSKDGLPVQFKDPDEDIAPKQEEYVKNYFNTIEEILIGGNPRSLDVFDYIDMDSFIDWWLVHELSGNIEPWHPKSSYMHKDRNGKLCAGPVWDFDYGTYRRTGESGYRSGLILKDAMWYHWLFLDSRFVKRVKERWAMHKPVIQKIADEYIDAKMAEISESIAMNKKRWPGSSGTSYVIKDELQFRIDEIDKAIAAL
ncbi:MAG: CotH kinase family protein [Alistipes sp.]|nr:CotH kinase family protein [Alistipes sp.]